MRRGSALLATALLATGLLATSCASGPTAAQRVQDDTAGVLQAANSRDVAGIHAAAATMRKDLRTLTGRGSLSTARAAQLTALLDRIEREAGLVSTASPSPSATATRTASPTPSPTPAATTAPPTTAPPTTAPPTTAPPTTAPPTTVSPTTAPPATTRPPAPSGTPSG